MSRAQNIFYMVEDFRGAHQVFITPGENSCTVKYADDHLGNPDLKFPPVTLSHDELFDIIPHNDMTQATFQNALERGDTYGLFVNPWAVSRLSRHGVPNNPQKYQHTLNRQEPTSDDFNRSGQMSGRV
jgi:hypothetical protein